jgi:ferritin-like metal-binding protein YciE
MTFAQPNHERMCNLLNERLAFERAGVKLYDRVLEALREARTGDALEMVGTLQKHRDQEAEHVHWLESAITKLGGNCQVETELSQLAAREARGIEEVVESDRTEPAHLLHALLSAEAVDNAGWDLLCHLADDAGGRELKREVHRRMREEQAHLAWLRDALEEISGKAIFGEDFDQERANDVAASYPP